MQTVDILAALHPLTQPPSRTCSVARFPAHGLRMRASRDIEQRRFLPEVLESKSPMQRRIASLWESRT